MAGPSPVGRLAGLARFLELQNLALNLPFALGFLWIATDGAPSVRTTVLIVVAFVAARNAGHSFNRWTDRDLDARNPRTAGRLLVRRPDLAPVALAFAGASAVLLVACAYLLSPLALVLVPVAILIVLGYSLTKRLSSLTTIFLGLVEAITPAAVYAGATDTLPPAAWLASGAMLCWGTAFELIHSLGDREADARLGLPSLPLALGPGATLRLLYVAHALALAGLAVFGLLAGLGPGYFLALALVALGAAYVDRGVSLRPDEARAPFRWHYAFAALFLVGALTGYLRGPF